MKKKLGIILAVVLLIAGIYSSITYYNWKNDPFRPMTESERKDFELQTQKTPLNSENEKKEEAKKEDGITYSGNLDNGQNVSFKIKMIGDRTYLIANGNQSLLTFLSNGRYMVEDGPMVGMTLDPSKGACTIYSVDGEMVAILPVRD